MKPKINDSKCGARKECKIIEVCPVNAISYTEVQEPVIDDNTCNCTSADNLCDCGCDCDCSDATVGKIVIDYDKCIECGACETECCGNAIDMID